MGRRKKVESVKVVIPTTIVKDPTLTCHQCGQSKPMAKILCVQNKGPLCFVCGDYDEITKKPN